MNDAALPIKISVATVTYNAADLLYRTLRSVERQDYPFIEHIIVDGNSKDNTLELVQQYQERNTISSNPHEINMTSEPDNGIYDAMNKAIFMATGDYILFLNAGDCFHSNSTISQIVKVVNDNKDYNATYPLNLPMVVYGNTHIVDDKGNFIRSRRLSPPKKLSWKSFRQGMLVCHQAFFARLDIAKKFFYDLRYRYSADFDWCIRIMKEAHRQHSSLTNAKLVVADFMEGGISSQRHRQSLFERFDIMRRHYGLLQTMLLHAYFVIRAIFKK